jgi:hypothetical protein
MFNLTGAMLSRPDNLKHLLSPAFMSGAQAVCLALGLTPFDEAEWSEHITNPSFSPGSVFSVVNSACYRRLLRLPQVDLNRMCLGQAMIEDSFHHPQVTPVPTVLNGYV